MRHLVNIVIDGSVHQIVKCRDEEVVTSPTNMKRLPHSGGMRRIRSRHRIFFLRVQPSSFRDLLISMQDHNLNCLGELEQVQEYTRTMIILQDQAIQVCIAPT